MNAGFLSRQFKKEESFTLVELLIVIGILAILTVAVLIVINPAEYLKQARDSQRVQDLKGIDRALATLEAIDPTVSLGTASTVYVSIPDSDSGCANLGLPNLPSGWSYACVASSTLYDVDGTGWIPVNFSTGGVLSLATLPIDPTNTTSSSLYYTYTPGGSWALTAAMESSKYQTIALNISQNENERYEIGSNTSVVATTVYGGADEPESVSVPTVVTSAASDTAYGYSTATVNGTVNPNGNSTTYWFEYGPTLSYGSSTSPQSAGSGSEVVAAQASLTGLSGGTQYYVRLVAQNDGGTTNGSAVSFYTDVNTSLVAHWKMDNSWASAVGSYTGTGYGGIGFTMGQINQAGVFDGSDNYVQVAHSSNLNPGTGDMTIMFWGKRDAGTKKGGLTKISGDMTWPQGESTTGYGLLMNSDDAVVFTISNNTSNYRKSAATSALSDAGWHHIVATWDYSEQQVVIYVDGVASNNSNSTAGTVTSIGYTHATRFGCLSSSYCSSNNILDGYMDDARYYNRELSSDEALAIYEATK